MPHRRPRVGAEIRDIRVQLQLSQRQFADLLKVSAETYRTWDSGRRRPPGGLIDKAHALQLTHDPNRRMSLQELAKILGVHVRTLRDAARTGRLTVAYDNRVVFRNLVPRATLEAGQHSYGSTTGGHTRDLLRSQ